MFSFEKLEERNLLSNTTILDLDLTNDGRVDVFDLQSAIVHQQDLDKNEIFDAFDLQLIALNLNFGQQFLEAPTQLIQIGPQFQIGAYYDMAGNPTNVRSLSYNVERLGWRQIIHTFVKPIAEAGVPFAEFHNPWGRPEGDRPMEFPHYDELVNNESFPLLIHGFVDSWKQFHTDFPDFETIAYIGSPYTSPRQRELQSTPAEWWNLVYETVIPFLQAGFTSLGFDASGSVNIWKYPLDLELFDILMHPENRVAGRDDILNEVTNGQAIQVYFEAIPVNSWRNGIDDRANTLDHDHLIITWEHYRKLDPENLDENGFYTAHPAIVQNAEKYSELEEINIIIPSSSCRGTEEQTYEESRAACLNLIKDVLIENYRSVSAAGNVRVLINPRFIVHQFNNQFNWNTPTSKAVTYNNFIEELGPINLPTRINLDPNEINKDAKYTVFQPENGSISTEGNIVIYTANAGFKGVDYLNWIVEKDGRQKRGRIIIEVL